MFILIVWNIIPNIFGLEKYKLLEKKKKKKLHFKKYCILLYGKGDNQVCN